jgi:hypothetical protein
MYVPTARDADASRVPVIVDVVAGAAVGRHR